MFWLRMGKTFGLVSRKSFEDKAVIHPIEKSGLFNKKWYLEQYPEAKEMNMHPIKHYLEIGWKKGYNPSPKFNNDAYLNDYPDVMTANICPLIHYINHGRKERRRIRIVLATKTSETAIKPKDVYETLKKSKLFNKKWYLSTYPEVAKAKADPIKYYIDFGCREGHNPSKYFDTNYYLNLYNDVKNSEMNPLYHYIKYGCNMGYTAKTVDEKDLILDVSLKQKLLNIFGYPLRLYDKCTELKYAIEDMKNTK